MFREQSNKYFEMRLIQTQQHTVLILGSKFEGNISIWSVNAGRISVCRRAKPNKNNLPSYHWENFAQNSSTEGSVRTKINNTSTHAHRQTEPPHGSVHCTLSARSLSLSLCFSLCHHGSSFRVLRVTGEFDDGFFCVANWSTAHMEKMGTDMRACVCVFWKILILTHLSNKPSANYDEGKCTDETHTSLGTGEHKLQERPYTEAAQIHTATR